MLCGFFHEGPVRYWVTVQQAEAGRFTKYFHARLDQGIYQAPSPFEAVFLSTAHPPDILDITLSAAERAFRAVAASVRA
jgi:glutamate-1-semialdehyde 2,1-aminomutase